MARNQRCLSSCLLGLAVVTQPITAAAAIAVRPASSDIRLNATQTFTASGAPAGAAMVWQLISTAPNSKPDTTGALGKIDTAGKYTAPSVLPSPNTLLVKYVDPAHAGVEGSAAVTLLNPAPTITSLAPTFMNSGLKSTLVITGTGFVPGSLLFINDKAAPTATYAVKSATEIDYTDTPGAAATWQVTVVNPDPGGKASNARSLTINEPVTVTLAPDNKSLRGGTSLTLIATVKNHTNKAVTWAVNGKPNGDATVGRISVDDKGVVQYTAPWVIPGATVTLAATSVADPRASDSITVNLQNPTPLISAVTPAVLTIGSTAPITITGKGFAKGATVSVGGQAFTAQVQSDTSLVATGTVGAVAGRKVSIKVSNIAPGPIASAPFVVAEAVAKKCTASGQPAECMPYADAVRLLEMATFGPTPDGIAHLQEIGRDAWLAEQFAAPSPQWPLATDLGEGANRIQDVFFTSAMTGDSQLRQRVAFALSEIFVVSATKDNRFAAVRSYLQDLSDNAFGSYRKLLDVMTLNPAMGWFLDMVNNDKANPAKNTVANENYAREVMQLFSLGLVALDPTGTPVPNAAPAYDETTVSELAKVFTGWTYPAVPGTVSHWTNSQYFVGPMVSFPAHHDPTLKQIRLAGQPACVVNAGGSPEQDLQTALDCLARHPNVAPFISYRLIQRLVKSSPTPGFVQDIATVFNNTQGNLQEVVKAILKHPEAAASGSGKLREPVVFATSLLRALNATVLNQTASGIAGQSSLMGEKVLYAPSVFNYFSPFYRIPGVGVVAPEFQSLNAASSLSRLNFVYKAVNNQLSGNIKVDLSNLYDLAADPDALVEALSQALYHGAMDTSLRSNLVGIVNQMRQTTKDPATIVKAVVYFAAAAPQYQVEQ